jgi:hypothetical protein
MMTMQQLLKNLPRGALKEYSLPKYPSPTRHFASKKMNSLQEASRIFRAFQKGSPTFGAWQVWDI